MGVICPECPEKKLYKRSIPSFVLVFPFFFISSNTLLSNYHKLFQVFKLPNHHHYVSLCLQLLLRQLQLLLLQLLQPLNAAPAVVIHSLQADRSDSVPFHRFLRVQFPRWTMAVSYEGL